MTNRLKSLSATESQRLLSRYFAKVIELKEGSREADNQKQELQVWHETGATWWSSCPPDAPVPHMVELLSRSGRALVPTWWSSCPDLVEHLFPPGGAPVPTRWNSPSYLGELLSSSGGAPVSICWSSCLHLVEFLTPSGRVLVPIWWSSCSHLMELNTHTRTHARAHARTHTHSINWLGRSVLQISLIGTLN